MRQLVSICELLAVIFISGCSSHEPPIQSKNEIYIQKAEPDLTENSKNQETTGEDVIEDTEKVQDVANTSENADTPAIYSISDFKRSDFETPPYLIFGESVSIFESGNEIGTVTLDSYEIIQDSNGSNRKGLVLFFIETNTGTGPLELGIYQLNRLSLAHVFYEEIYLDIMDPNAPLEYKVSEPSYEDIKVCGYNTILNPGDSRTCYRYYSYAGEGEYLVSLSTNIDDLSTDWRSFLVSIPSVE